MITFDIGGSVNDIRFFAILPAVGAAPEEIIHSIQSLRKTDCHTLYVHSPDDVPMIGPEVTSIPCSEKTVGGVFEAARSANSGDFYIWVPPGVTMTTDFLSHFKKAYAESPDASLFLTDYLLDNRRTDLFPLRDDLTEREDMGIAFGIPEHALQTIGGFDKDLKFAAFYDLRLKLMEAGPLYHIKEALFCNNKPGRREI